MTATVVDWTGIQRGIRAWVVGGSQLPAEKVYWGGQDSPKLVEPSIAMEVYARHTLGMPWLSREVQYDSFTPIAITAVSTSTSTLTVALHGFGNGDGPVRPAATGAVPGGLDANTDYWVIVLDDNTIQLATSYQRSGGLIVNNRPSTSPIVPVILTSSGSGSLTINSTPKTVRAGREIRYVSRTAERLTIMLKSSAATVVGAQSALPLLNRIVQRQALPSQQSILLAAGIGLTFVERPRIIKGVRNAVQFEPRAIMEVYFMVPAEESEDGAGFDGASVTSQ